jgi:hypothetical protein
MKLIAMEREKKNYDKVAQPTVYATDEPGFVQEKKKLRNWKREKKLSFIPKKYLQVLVAF